MAALNSLAVFVYFARLERRLCDQVEANAIPADRTAASN
jgi:hypothetical protein